MQTIPVIPPHEQKRIEHEDRVRHRFNDWACSSDLSGLEREHGPVADKVIAQMDLGPDDSVLDLGCGDGWTSRRLGKICTAGAVVGIDVSDEMIRLAREKSADFDNLLFAVGAAEEIPWAEDYFTRVLSIESAYYWFSPERAVRELFRVTAFGGAVFLLMGFYQENVYSHDWQQHVGLPLHLMSEGEWADLLRSFGFEGVETSRVVGNADIAKDYDAEAHGASRDVKVGFETTGYLLVTGRKPGLPPPGPIDPPKRKPGFKIFR